MEKRMQIEGSAASIMIQLMQKHGYNKDVDVEVGTVIAPLPNIIVRVGTDAIDLDVDDLIIAEHLTDHTRTVNIPGVTTGDTQMTVKSSLKAGDRVIVISGDDSQLYYVIAKAKGGGA